MNHFTVSGMHHQLAPYLVVHQLLHSECTIRCVTDDDRVAAQLALRIHAALSREAGGDRIEALTRRLTLGADAPAATSAAAGTGRHVHFLSTGQLAALLGGHPAAPAGTPDALCVVVDRHQLPPEPGVDGCLRAIEEAMTAAHAPGTRIAVVCLGLCVDDDALLYQSELPADAPLDRLVARATSLMTALSRRSMPFLAHYPLQLLQHAKETFRIMPASAAAAVLAGAPSGPSRQLVIGAHGLDIASVLAQVVGAVSGKLQTACAAATPRNAASAMLDACIAPMAAYAQSETAAIGAARGAALTVHELAGTIDLSVLLSAMRQSKDAESARMQGAYGALPGLQCRHTGRPGLRYFSQGSGPNAVLLVNAFGLSLDFWQMLSATLGAGFQVIALERNGATEAGVPTTCYGSDNYLADFLADVTAVLDGEAIERCHVVSWCGGAKFALELAHAFPDRIASLSLLAPSFAGMDGFSGKDSAYEKNLHTMCKIVAQAPKAADTMAGAMLAIMEKSGKDIERFAPGQKDAVDVMELADSNHLPLLYRPFSSPPNLVEFSRQLMRFRSHDIRTLLASGKLQLPVMLVTGGSDTTTSSERAKDICGRLPKLVRIEIDGASHYLIHQEHDLIAALLTGFIRQGADLDTDVFRVTRRDRGTAPAAGRASIRQTRDAALSYQP